MWQHFCKERKTTRALEDPSIVVLQSLPPVQWMQNKKERKTTRAFAGSGQCTFRITLVAFVYFFLYCSSIGVLQSLPMDAE